MTDEEATLDRFAGTDGADGEEPVDPVEPTHAFDADGGGCADCEAAVDRRWRHAGRLVCTDCKRWSPEDASPSEDAETGGE